jgi:hypothetical protein
VDDKDGVASHIDRRDLTSRHGFALISPVPHRRIRATELRTLGSTLLATARNHELQNFVKRALSEIDDADAWLSVSDVDTRPALLTIIDMDLAFAEYRLQAARVALQCYGPDTPTIG